MTTLILLHGTTRSRAEGIVSDGPDQGFCEPGTREPVKDFSTYLEGGPYLCKPPEVYARHKARDFPGDRGPVILRMEVPEEIVQRAVDDKLPLEYGLVQFDLDNGSLGALINAWSRVKTEIRDVP